MTNVIELQNGGESAEIIEVATSQLTVHSKQGVYSPEMSKKKRTEFLAGIKKNGILQPLFVTKGFRVIDGKNRLQAAKDLGIESVRVVIEDIPENDIPAYIVENKLNKDELKNGQKAALAMRFHYNEERENGKRNQGNRTDLTSSPIGEKVDTHDRIAKMAGVGKGSIGRLLPVYRNRPDLFERVFNGEYSINKAYTEMKADEAPEEVEEVAQIDKQRQEVEAITADEEKLPQVDETQPANSLNNRIVQMRKKALSLTVEVLDESDHMHEAKTEVKESARVQLLALARTCILALGQTTNDDDDAELFAVCFELLKKTNGGI